MMSWRAVLREPMRLPRLVLVLSVVAAVVLVLELVVLVL